MIAGADVRVIQVLTGVERKVLTDPIGHYVAVSLQPGIYDIEVEHSGFRTLKASGIELGSGRTVYFDLELEVGSDPAVIEVIAALPLLSTSAEELGWTGSREQFTGTSPKWP